MGPRIAYQIIKRSPGLAVSESAVYRCLRRAGLIEPDTRRRRRKDWKRWERGEPNELCQMDVVGGFLIADNSRAKALTGIDDHSRMCVSAKLMAAERTRLVRAGLSMALHIYGVPEHAAAADTGFTSGSRTPHPAVRNPDFQDDLLDALARFTGVPLA